MMRSIWNKGLSENDVASSHFSAKVLLILIMSSCICFFNPDTSDAQDPISRAVVKVIATQKLPDLSKPWSKKTQREMSGSGVVIEGRRILTNAHVVAFSKQIYVQPYQSAEKFLAKVLVQAPEVDLALLTLDDETFFDDNPALSFSDALPKIKDPVNVHGYPLGGFEQSVTEGIVSRIEYDAIFYDSPCLLIQIDAALNPGNSGGAAVNEGKMIGVVCSKIMSAENIGFIIPIEEIEMFLEDAEDGMYDGQPRLHGVGLQTAENDALRAKLKIGKDITGIVAFKVTNIHSDFPLKPWDLITHMGEHRIDNDGRIHIHGDLRLPATYLVPRIAKDEKIPVSIIRDGQTKKLTVPVSIESQKLIRFKGFKYPRYFIYGPLVFSEINYLHAHQFLQKEQLPLYLASTGSPIITRLTDTVSFEGEELVGVFSPMFPHRITKGYDTRRPLGVLTHVNGAAVRNLTHLVKFLRDNEDAFVFFEFANAKGECLVFRRTMIESVTEEILSDNGIRHQCSVDLRKP